MIKISYYITNLYDADGNETKRTWARGVVTNYAYDNAGRLTGKTYSDGTPSVNLTYDALGRQATVGGLTYTYNNKGYLTGIGGMSYYYDAYGRRSSAIHMTSIVEYTYDIRSRLATVSSPSSYYKATYNYNAKNQLAGYAVTSMQTPTAAFYSQVRTFDDYGRLTGIKQETPPTSLQGNGYNETYTYNSANQLTSRSSGRSYTYNAIGELASEVRSEYTTNYIYDLIGNRQTMSVVRTTGTTSTNYTGNNVNRYTAVGSTSYANAYDADGNMVLYNGWMLGWDGENRLKSASKGSTNISYAYDALNRRISETNGTNTTHFTWDGYNLFHEITLTTNGIGNASEKSYVWGLDLSGTLQGAGGVGGLLWQDDNITHEKSFAFYDNNGNITKYIKSNYTLGASYTYDAFLNGSTGTAYRFQASTKSWNNDLGLLDYQFRAYSPTLGRFIQEDPIEEQGGNNLYAFVGNNPITIWDNWGLKSLGRKIREEYIGRAVYGIYIIPNIATSEDTVGFWDEEHELIDVLKTLMGKAVLYHAYKQKLKNKWEQYTISPGINLANFNNGVVTMDSSIVFSTGYWLGSSSKVLVVGTYEACESNDYVHYRNAIMTYAWFDIIDAHSYSQLSNESWDSMLAEGTVDLIGDKVLWADFPILVNGDTMLGDIKDERIRRSDIPIKLGVK